MSDARSERHPAVGRPGGSGGSTPHAEERRKGNFVQESWAELKKVEWPGQNQVIQGTVVVLIACLVVGSYLYLNDIVWKHVVSKVFLGQ
jgi:preprotein translocase SecE subunit